MAKTHRPVLILLTIVALFRTAAAAAATPAVEDLPAALLHDAAAFIPSCAAPCLASFLAVNYARGDGDSDRYLTLDFVCAHAGRSGYTLSEGALQCLAGEHNVGYCSDDDAGDAAVSKANSICSDKPNAAKPKGGVITATLEYGSTSGILTFAPITTSASSLPIPTPTTTTASSSTSSSSSPPSTETTLITAPPTTTSTTASPSRTTTSITTSSQTTTPTPEPAAGPPQQPPLSKGQIAGISIGAVCIAAGLVLGALLIVRFLRRRRRRRYSGSSFGGGSPPALVGGGRYVQPHGDSWGYRFDKSSNGGAGTSTSDNSSWAAREQPGMSRYPAMPAVSGGGGGGQPQPNDYNRTSWRRSAIGFAISSSKASTPSRHTPTPPPPRPLSKLLPAKPDMAPTPKITTTSPPPPSSTPPGMRPSYQESRGSRVPPQDQDHLHPIAATFMRPPPTAKPPTSLRLVIPDDAAAAKPPLPPIPQDKEQPLSFGGRESTLTEFEEDDAAAADVRDSASTVAGQIWCPPPSAGPDSAGIAPAPYYIADAGGNWILGDPKCAPPPGGKDALSPTEVATARAGIVATAVQTQIPPPKRSPREPPPPPPPASTATEKEVPQQQQDGPHELSATPLKLDNTQQQPPKTPRIGAIMRGVGKVVPSPLFSRHPNPRSVSQPLPNNNNNTASDRPLSLTGAARPGQARVLSGDSCVTTFSSCSAACSDDDDCDNTTIRQSLPAPGKNLSPVAESPRGRATTPVPAAPRSSSTDGNVFAEPPPIAAASESGGSSGGGGGGGGVSPVSYPRIQGRSTPASRGRGMLPGGAPPPRMALLSSSQSDIAGPPPVPPRYSRSGGSMARGGRGGSVHASQDMGRGRPTLRPPPQIAPDQLRTGSPTMRIVSPSPEPQPGAAPPPPHPAAAVAPPRDDRSLLPSSAAAAAPRRRPPSHLPHPFPMYPVPRTRAPPAIPSITVDRDSFSRYPGHPMPMPRPYRPQDRHASWRPDSSSQEALAASSSSPSSLLAKRVGTTRAADMALAPPRQGGGGGGDGREKGKREGSRKHVAECLASPELPSTPNWLPRLTPTRRGTDLVLDVG